MGKRYIVEIGTFSVLRWGAEAEACSMTEDEIRASVEQNLEAIDPASWICTKYQTLAEAEAAFVSAKLSINATQTNCGAWQIDGDCAALFEETLDEDGEVEDARMIRNRFASF